MVKTIKLTPQTEKAILDIIKTHHYVTVQDVRKHLFQQYSIKLNYLTVQKYLDLLVEKGKLHVKIIQVKKNKRRIYYPATEFLQSVEDFRKELQAEKSVYRIKMEEVELDELLNRLVFEE